MKRIVITGGTCSGKTTLVSTLRKQGFNTVPESAIQIVEEEVARLGITDHVRQKTKNFARFIAAVTDRQLQLEASISARRNEVIFQDRGLHDYIAFCTLFKVRPPKKLLVAVEKRKYHRIFFCEQLSHFDVRRKTGRIINKRNAAAVGKIIREVYRYYGYDVRTVGRMSVEKRAEFVLNNC